MKNKLVLSLLFVVLGGMQASSSDLEEYYYGDYLVAGSVSLFDSPTKYISHRMHRRDSASKTSRKHLFNDEDGIALDRKNSKNQTKRHISALKDKKTH